MSKNISSPTYKALAEDKMVKCNCTASAIKVTLPESGDSFTVEKTDSSANVVTVVPAKGQDLYNATRQVETTTVVGAITGSGNATVVVTAAGMEGSPLTLSVPVLSGDAIAVTANRIKSVMNVTKAITDMFTVSGTGATVVLTQIEPTGNDSTLNISIDNGTCTGLTTAATSTDTTAGVAVTVSTQNEYATFVNNGTTWVKSDVGGVNATETLANKTLTSPTLTTPKIATGGSINDAGGDEYIKFTEASTPVTYIGITSGNTTVAPQVRGAGETNTDLMLAGTGTGNVLIGDGADLTKKISIELSGATTAKTMTIASPHTDDRTLTLPDATDTLVGKATTDTLTNKTLDSAGTGNHLKNVVLSYAASITRAEMITGKTLVAAVASRTIRVLGIKLSVVGAFDGGAGTSFIIQDTNDTPVVILTALKAALTDGAKISTEGLAIANVTEGAGLTGNLTASKGIAVAADAAWDAGTNIYMVINYMYV